jgi:glutaconate CoA-transferase subunit A
MIDAVVIEPWAAHPTDSYRYYFRDLEHHALYGRMSKTEQGYREYLDEWVFGCPTHHDLLAKLGQDRVQALQARASWWK